MTMPAATNKRLISVATVAIITTRRCRAFRSGDALMGPSWTRCYLQRAMRLGSALPLANVGAITAWLKLLVNSYSTS